jgi:hypothetical protein
MLLALVGLLIQTGNEDDIHDIHDIEKDKS